MKEPRSPARLFRCTWYIVHWYLGLFLFALGGGIRSEEFLLYICRNELVGIELHGEGSASAGQRREGR